jgi:hypothetical protein
MSTQTKTQSVPLDVGIHYGVKAIDYHSDPCPQPSLSSGAARTIIFKSLADAHREHSRFGGKQKQTTEAMNTGSIVHSLLAENLTDFEVGLFDNFRSKAAQAWRDEVILSGKNAVLECDLDHARKIEASIRKNICNGGVTNNPFADYGRSEVTIIWKEGDAYCRALPDRLLIDPNGAFTDVWDWKVTNDVTDLAIMRSVVKWGYHHQEAFYRRGLAATLPKSAGSVSWTFAFVLDHEPFTVRRVCLMPEFVSAGKADMNKAINLWRHAMLTNEWPDQSHETLHLDAPAYLIDDDISSS